MIRGKTRYLSNASVATQRTVGVINRVLPPSKIVPVCGMPELGVIQLVKRLEMLRHVIVMPLLLNQLVRVLACCVRSNVVAAGGCGIHCSVSGSH